MVKIGLVGVGGMGTVHYSNYNHIDGCRVVALVGATEQDKEKAAAWGLPLYSAIGEMVQEEEIDIVDICTPTFLHKQHALESIGMGKHTIVEKPLALHLADGAELFQKAEEKGVLLFVGQVLRFSKEAGILKELVESGTYGKPLDGYFERLSACPRWAQGGWLFDKEKSGQLLFDLHIHDLDLIISIFGEPKTHMFTSCGGRDKTYREHYRFIYGYEGFNIGAEAAWFNADIPFTARWRVYFENAVVIHDGSQVVAYEFDKEPRVFDNREEVKIPTGINLPPTGIFLEELTHFVQCVQNGTPSNRVKKDQILCVLALLEKMLGQDQGQIREDC